MHFISLHERMGVQQTNHDTLTFVHHLHVGTYMTRAGSPWTGTVCNDTYSQTVLSVFGSGAGDVVEWNRLMGRELLD